MNPAADNALRGLVGYNLKRASSVVQAEVGAILAAYGLRIVTYSVLSVLTDNPGMRQAQLSEALSVERPNLVQIIDELEKAGLITRARDAEDRRAWALSVTPEGARVHAAAAADVLAFDMRLTAGLGPAERARILAALQRLETCGKGGP